MSSSAEQGYAAEWSSRESGSSGTRDVPTGNSLRSTSALQDLRRTTISDLPKNLSPAARQREDHLPSGSAVWKAGHCLIDRYEYGQAAEYFSRMLHSSDRLTVEAAEVAVQLCAALSREQSVEKKLRDTCSVLDRDLSQLSHEEVSLARGVLATCVEKPPAEVPVRVAAQPRLRVHFFGRFEFLQDGEVMCLGRNAKALAILKYLIAHQGDRPVSQDYLMGWLWPESDPRRARWSLNSAVYTLRKLLSSRLPFLSTSEAIAFDEGGYRLSPRVLLSTDTEEFDSHYEEGLRLEEAGRVPEAVAEYEEAAKLYRGDYLVEDLYEDWTMIERERLIEAYTDLSRRLAARYMECGRLREGVRFCYRVLQKDRSDEDAHRLLMECFACLGQRGRALRQYGLCEQALRNNYDTPPSPGIRALYTSILKDGDLR
jgi:DNA-binding SARP family transcriptional activator